MASWLSGHQASMMACILTRVALQHIHKGSWFWGEINNSAKVMNTYRQQSSVNGIEVVIFTPIGMILNTSLSLISS